MPKIKISKQELKKGIREEMEHTSSKKQSKKIAIDHLKEHSNYYTKLKKAGLAESYELGGETYGVYSEVADQLRNAGYSEQEISNLIDNAIRQEFNTRWVDSSDVLIDNYDSFFSAKGSDIKPSHLLNSI